MVSSGVGPKNVQHRAAALPNRQGDAKTARLPDGDPLKKVTDQSICSIALLSLETLKLDGNWA